MMVSLVNTLNRKIHREYVLKIIVGKATSRYEQTLAVNIYDCLGNIVNTATLNIEGDKQAKVPLLGSTAKDVMTNTAKSLTSAYGLLM